MGREIEPFSLAADGKKLLASAGWISSHESTIIV